MASMRSKGVAGVGNVTARYEGVMDSKRHKSLGHLKDSRTEGACL